MVRAEELFEARNGQYDKKTCFPLVLEIGLNIVSKFVFMSVPLLTEAGLTYKRKRKSSNIV